MTTPEHSQYPQPQQPPATYYQQPPAGYAPPQRPAGQGLQATGGIWTIIGVLFAGLIFLISFIGAIASDSRFGMVCMSLLGSSILLLGFVLFAEIFATGLKSRLDKK
ncbi:MAG: hypothetical protein FWG16_06630 [Micrococcales bacterium]|nr:hypothetical protein [Micrococcales bacterium]